MLDHEKHMRMCIDLALKAEGRTAPNPMVGSVIVDDSGVVIASGYHRQAGQKHAETEAVSAAGEKARGKTLYVNLEPCSHVGRQGPCSKALIAAGIKRVVIGSPDPNPKVNGQGVQELKEHGIEVIENVLVEQCNHLNRAFFKYIKTGRPWLILKMASTLDGRIADHELASRWISGPQARAHVQHLRNSCDGVLIGSTTAEADDPSLTVKDVEGGRNPKRFALNSNLTLNATAKLVALAQEDEQTWIFCSEEAHAAKAGDLPPQVKLLPVKRDGEGLSLPEVMDKLGQLELLTILCEGGGKLAGALIDQELVDEIHWIIAPKLLVSNQARVALFSRQPRLLKDVLELNDPLVNKLGDDILVIGYLKSALPSRLRG